MEAILTALLTILSVALVDSLLSVDNALVLALVVEHLPADQRTNALRYGILGAYLMRGASILLASLLSGFWLPRVIGGGYLLWLALSNLFARSSHQASATNGSPAYGFWRTVVLVEAMDFIFSFDNILATVALSRNTLVVIFGVFISILAMRFVAGFFLHGLQRFPFLRKTAYLLVLFIGGKLIASGFGMELAELETFIGLFGIVVASLAYERLGQRRGADRSADPSVSEEG